MLHPLIGSCKPEPQGHAAPLPTGRPKQTTGPRALGKVYRRPHVHSGVFLLSPNRDSPGSTSRQEANANGALCPLDYSSAAEE